MLLESVERSGAGLNVDNLSSFELTRSGQQILDYRHLASETYGDEPWLGFEDLTAGDSLGTPHQPCRIVRILPGCVYPSVWEQGEAAEPQPRAIANRTVLASFSCRGRDAHAQPDPLLSASIVAAAGFASA